MTGQSSRCVEEEQDPTDLIGQSSPNLAPSPHEEVINRSIVSEFEKTVVEAAQMIDSTARFLVSLSREPLSLYHDQESGKLHVLLDVTVTCPAVHDGLETPLGAAAPRFIFSRFEKTLSCLRHTIFKELHRLSLEEWTRLHNSLCTYCGTSKSTGVREKVAYHSGQYPERLEIDSDTSASPSGQDHVDRNAEESTTTTLEGSVVRRNAESIAIYSERRQSSRTYAELTSSTMFLPVLYEDDVQRLTSRLNAETQGMLAFTVHPRLGKQEDDPKVPWLIAGPDTRFQVTLVCVPWGQCHEVEAGQWAPPPVPEVGHFLDHGDDEDEK